MVQTQIKDNDYTEDQEPITVAGILNMPELDDQPVKPDNTEKAVKSSRPTSHPWSVKGISDEARALAKKRARQDGITIGEWLDGLILSQADSEQSNNINPAENPTGMSLPELAKLVLQLAERLNQDEKRYNESFAAVNNKMETLRRYIIADQ